MGDIGLGVEFALVVDTALDLLRAERVKDCWNSMQKGVRFLVCFNAFIESGECLRLDGFENGPPSPMGGLRSHQDPDLVEFLPLAFKDE